MFLLFYCHPEKCELGFLVYSRKWHQINDFCPHDKKFKKLMRMLSPFSSFRSITLLSGQPDGLGLHWEASPAHRRCRTIFNYNKEVWHAGRGEKKWATSHGGENCVCALHWVFQVISENRVLPEVRIQSCTLPTSTVPRLCPFPLHRTLKETLLSAGKHKVLRFQDTAPGSNSRFTCP